MNDPLTTYFAGEKHAGLLCLALAAAATALAIWVWRAHVPFRAMAVPLLIIVVVQVSIGGTMVTRSDRQVATLQADLARDPAPARAKELARMERVNASFRLVEMLEVVLIVAALVMAFAFRGRPAVTGFGLGLLVQTAIMLAFDVFAEHRAHVYTAWLRG